MSSNFQKFLEGFIDEETDKDNKSNKEDSTNTQEVEQPMQHQQQTVQEQQKPIQQQPQSQQIERKNIVKEEVSTDNVNKEEINEPQKPKPKLKLNLLKNKPKEKKEPQIVLNNQPSQPKVPQNQTNTANKPDIDKEKIKERNEQLELEKLFAKSYTPLEHKEKWMATIKKARQSDMKTMLNRKVRTGKFRFNSIGELEILPDLDTSGKSSKEILSIKWDKEEV